MKLPRSVKILGVNYKIKMVSRRWENGQCWGEINHETCVIKLREDLNYQKKWEVLLHEILHAVVFHADLNLKHNQEEVLVERMDEILFAVLRDNGFLKIR